MQFDIEESGVRQGFQTIFQHKFNINVNNINYAIGALSVSSQAKLRRRHSMALRLRFWKTAGLRILLITLFFAFTCGVLIYFIKNKNYHGTGDDDMDGSKFECMNDGEKEKNNFRPRFSFWREGKESHIEQC